MVTDFIVQESLLETKNWLCSQELYFLFRNLVITL